MSSGSTVDATLSASAQWYCPSCEQNFDVGERCPDDGTRLVKLATQIDPFLGRELDGRFTVLEKIGQGGMGSVYRGNQHSVGREVAIKVVNPGLLTQQEVIKRFLRECKLASRLSHPNAVSVIDFGQTDDGVLFLVMELVAGRTLDNVIKSERVFKPERVVRIGTQVCDALEGAHALSIIHRDLKPSNIILMSSGRDLVKVLDFGLAKSLAPDQTSTTMTGTGAVLGTPAYMPPELATGQPCDARADLYSLGVMLYLLGSGRLPFMSDSVHELVAAHAAEPPPPMTGVPPALCAVIDKLLAKRPEDRYQSAVETRQALEDALAGRPSSESGAWNEHERLPNETMPSVGPFPATASQFAHLKSQPASVPGARAPVRKTPSPADLEKLVASETLAVTPMPGAPRVRVPTPPAFPVLPGDTGVGGGVGAVPAELRTAETLSNTVPSIAPPARRRSGLWLGLGAAAVIASGVFAVTRGGGSKDAAPDPAPMPTTPAPAVMPKPEPTPTPTPVIAPKPDPIPTPTPAVAPKPDPLPIATPTPTPTPLTKHIVTHPRPTPTATPTPHKPTATPDVHPTTPPTTIKPTKPTPAMPF